MNEIMIPEKAGFPAEAAARIGEMAGQMRLLADMLRETNARMAAMEKTIRTLEKVTPR